MIIKSLTKLPKQFDMVIYPTLVTVTYENFEAKAILSKDFDIAVSPRIPSKIVSLSVNFTTIFTELCDGRSVGT